MPGTEPAYAHRVRLTKHCQKGAPRAVQRLKRVEKTSLAGVRRIPGQNLAPFWGKTSIRRHGLSKSLMQIPICRPIAGENGPYDDFFSVFRRVGDD
jgi:hypothetical protein